MRKTLFSFLMLMMLLGACFTVMATSYMETENFDTDTVGQPPSDTWYTYGNQGAGANYTVSNTQSYSSPNSFAYLAPGSFKNACFNFSGLIPASYLNFSFYPQFHGGYLIVYLYNGTATKEIVAINMLYSNRANITNGSYITFGYSNYNSWGNISIQFNWTTSKYRVMLKNDTGVTNYYPWEGTFGDGIQSIRFCSLVTPHAYIDDIVMTHPGVPPFITGMYPANTSTTLLTSVSWSVNVVDLEGDNATVDFYHYDNFNLTWVHVSTIGPASTPGTYGGVASVCAGETYYWYVNVTDIDGTTTSPVYQFTNINQEPTITFNYPVPGATYTALSWFTNHTLSFMVNDPEGDLFDIGIDIDMVNTSGVHTSLSGSGDPACSLYNQLNGTFTLDLRPYIPFDNMRYNITIFVSDAAYCGISGNYSYDDFNIGMPNTKYHFAIDTVTPAQGEQHAYTFLHTGITMNLSTTDAVDDGRTNLFAFLEDVTGSTIGRYHTLSGVSSVLRDWLQVYFIEPVYTGTAWYQKNLFHQGLESRQEYYLYLGCWKQGDSPGNNPVRYVSDTEFDHLYINATVTDFTYHMADFGKNDVFRWISDDWNGSNITGARNDNLQGWRIHFYTYPVGEQPGSQGGSMETGWHTSNWGADLEKNTGISWIGVIAGLFLVAGFALMPFLIAKRRQVRNVPSPISMTFTLFGFFLAFGMGLFPLWIFIPPTIIIALVLIYKTWTWITSRKQLVSTKEGIE